MTIDFQTPNFKADHKLLTFITEKLQKLNRFNNKIVNSTVYLKVNNSVTGDNKTVEVKLNLKDSQLFVAEKHGTFEGACELAIDALKAQLAKLKTKTLSA